MFYIKPSMPYAEVWYLYEHDEIVITSGVAERNIFVSDSSGEWDLYPTREFEKIKHVVLGPYNDRSNA